LDLPTALNKVCVKANRDKEEDVEIYSFGGLSTEGTSLFAKLNENLRSWKALDKSYLILNVIDDPELLFYPTLYIE
jgi:hypothetical protein